MVSARKPQVWPVIHILSPALALAAAEVAAECACAGVFLISMDGYDQRLDPIADELRKQLPALAIGVNYLTLTADRALCRSLDHGYQATWTDDAGLHSSGAEPLARQCRLQLKDHPGHLFFGAVGFKGQRHEPDPAAAARQALEHGMIPTTSGLATGVAPAAEKLISIRSAIGPEAPLAVASGITPENVRELGRPVSHILVSTGIAADFHTFAKEKLVSLMANLPVG
ncbi:hypothetical protein ACVIGB_000136 [Bradyrhizobium sp. USDA 4341]